MAVLVEAWLGAGRELFALEGDRATVGRGEESTIAVLDDARVSRLHAVFELLGGRWCLRDLSSRNGTTVNGERIHAERPLRHGDEIMVGTTRLVFRDTDDRASTLTEAAEPPPELTRRERDVLVALCGPVLRGDLFTEPASTRQIAEQLVVTEAAVKQHLANLYGKFRIDPDAERKRVRLANDAVQRGAVTVGDLKAT